MKITASHKQGPSGAVETAVSVEGDVVTYDGTPYDLSDVPEGGEAWPEGDHPFIGPITRTNGEIAATIFWVSGDDALLHQPIDPAHWVLNVTDGPVPSPIAKESSDGV